MDVIRFFVNDRYSAAAARNLVLSTSTRAPHNEPRATSSCAKSSHRQQQQQQQQQQQPRADANRGFGVADSNDTSSSLSTVPADRVQQNSAQVTHHSTSDGLVEGAAVRNGARGVSPMMAAFRRLRTTASAPSNNQQAASTGYFSSSAPPPPHHHYHRSGALALMTTIPPSVEESSASSSASSRFVDETMRSDEDASMPHRYGHQLACELEPPPSCGCGDDEVPVVAVMGAAGDGRSSPDEGDQVEAEVLPRDVGGGLPRSEGGSDESQLAPVHETATSFTVCEEGRAEHEDQHHEVPPATIGGLDDEADRGRTRATVADENVVENNHGDDGDLLLSSGDDPLHLFDDATEPEAVENGVDHFAALLDDSDVAAAAATGGHCTATDRPDGSPRSDSQGGGVRDSSLGRLLLGASPLPPHSRGQEDAESGERGVGRSRGGHFTSTALRVPGFHGSTTKTPKAQALYASLQEQEEDHTEKDALHEPRLHTTVPRELERQRQRPEPLRSGAFVSACSSQEEQRGGDSGASVSFRWCTSCAFGTVESDQGGGRSCALRVVEAQVGKVAFCPMCGLRQTSDRSLHL